MSQNIPFRQIEGTAMGAAFSPSIANIYMSVLLKSFLSKRSDKSLLIKRYIDDIFMIWQKHHDLNKFVDDINSYHPNIKFTFTQSDSAVDFLDITVYKGEDTKKLKVSTFQKENNLHQYLHFSSSHP
uniref:Reverse transcriptase domain-containing protein n=1 Tax=Amphimedon queenslandica TaxID=400682 RepID=A0A1X7SVF2_AMPQE